MMSTKAGSTQSIHHDAVHRKVPKRARRGSAGSRKLSQKTDSEDLEQIQEDSARDSIFSASNSDSLTYLAKAGCLLQRPQINVSFANDNEKKQVYNLIYDVFRYKFILTQALTDISFFGRHPKLQMKMNVVLLLFFDLYQRKFLPREDSEDLQRVLVAAGLLEIANILQKFSTRLAASLARIRIKMRVESLYLILPEHLKFRDEMHAQTPLYGWVNTFKVSLNEIENLLQKFESRLCESPEKEAYDGEEYFYKFDPLCPSAVLFHPKWKMEVIHSYLIQDKFIILQDRSFCSGPMVISHVLKDLNLNGCIIHTHVKSPRVTAYLASLVAKNPKINSLKAFGAGKRKGNFEDYLDELGVTNVVLYEDKFTNFDPEDEMFNTATAVLVSPPNTYSAVTDPVELVCSQDGDVEMLEEFTKPSPNATLLRRETSLIEEQKKTLRQAMCIPAVQVVLYTTHSKLEEENKHLVKKVIPEVNRLLYERKVNLQRLERQQNPNDSDKSLRSVSPFTEGEEFEIHPLPQITVGNGTLTVFDTENCYIAYIRRKEIIRIGPELMIDVAKKRGLFPGSGKRTKMKIIEYRPPSPKLSKREQKQLDEMLTRINAPTQASLWREAMTKNYQECRKIHGSSRFPPLFLNSGAISHSVVAHASGICCARHVHHHCPNEVSTNRCVKVSKKATTPKKLPKTKEIQSSKASDSQVHEENAVHNKKLKAGNYTSHPYDRPEYAQPSNYEQLIIERIAKPTHASVLRSVHSPRSKSHSPDKNHLNCIRCTGKNITNQTKEDSQPIATSKIIVTDSEPDSQVCDVKRGQLPHHEAKHNLNECSTMEYNDSLAEFLMIRSYQLYRPANDNIETNINSQNPGVKIINVEQTQDNWRQQELQRYLQKPNDAMKRERRNCVRGGTMFQFQWLHKQLS